MTTSKTLLFICLAFIAGVCLGSFLLFSIRQIFLVLMLSIFLLSVFWKYKYLMVIGLCLLSVIFGVWRYQAVQTKATNNELLYFNDKDEPVFLVGVVIEEPDIRNKSMKLTVLGESLIIGESSIAVHDRVLVTTNRYSSFQYGDRLIIKGRLVDPPVFDSFNHKDYLKKDGIYSMINLPEIELIDHNGGNRIMRTLFILKNKFKDFTRSFISPPQEGILEALIFGDEQELSESWKDKLNTTGTRHIAAVSGMNITIIGFLILSLALSLGLWRQQAFFLSIFLLLIYILIIGAPVSAVRAGIMGFILMSAQYFGRLSVASRAVVLAAAIMIYFNPFILKTDIGFQLSFLAILGLIYFQPTFSKWLIKVPDPKFFPIRTTLSASLSAQFFTAPILIYNFGYISLLSPITNVLIVPFLSPITIIIFLFGIVGMIFPWTGYLLLLPVWLSLTYIVVVIGWFSQFSFAILAIQNIHWFWLVFSYFVLTGFTVYIVRKEKFSFLNY